MLNSSLTFQELTVVSTTNCTFAGYAYKCGNLCIIHGVITITNISLPYAVYFNEPISDIQLDFLTTNYKGWTYAEQIQVPLKANNNYIDSFGSAHNFSYTRIDQVFCL